MKVASMAFDDYTNYGNNLQKYALQRTLKKFVDFTELIWHSSSGFFPETTELTYFVKPIPQKIDYISRQKYIFREIVRLSKMKEFEKRYIKTRFDIPYIEEIADDFGCN